MIFSSIGVGSLFIEIIQRLMVYFYYGFNPEEKS